jgi:hypothetical protein
MTQRIPPIQDYRKLRSFQIKKQYLFDPVPQEQYRDLLISQIGLHSTDVFMPYLSLWSRRRDFAPLLLFADLLSGRAVRMRAFRGTVFVVDKSQSIEILTCLPRLLRPKIKEVSIVLEKLGINPPEVENIVIQMLLSGENLSTRQIRERLPVQFETNVVSLLMRKMEISGIVVRSQPRYLTDRTIRWRLPENSTNTSCEEDKNARETITLKYIKQFGPICLKDLSWWFPITKTRAVELIKKLHDHLVELTIHETSYWMESEDFTNFQKCELLNPEDPVISILPYEDHFTKSFILRNWFLDPAHLALVTFEGRMFMGQIQPSIWINGNIVGRWEWNWSDNKKTRGSARIAALQSKAISSLALSRIEERLSDLELFMNKKMVPLIRRRD